MNGTELGKKIKEARIAKKMTQSEVVGSFITRNMLSQIESGTAYPSIKTLEYLAKVLGLPMNYLIPDDEREADSAALAGNPDGAAGADILSRLLKGKRAFSEERYSDAISAVLPLAEEKGPLADEAYAILARAFTARAVEADTAGQSAEAYDFAKKAAAYAGEGLYSGRDVKMNALLLLEKLSS